MQPSYYKYCIVPQCKSTSIKTPNKLFIYVPNIHEMRTKWLTLARRSDVQSLSLNSRMYFCEDHFDLTNDMENYIQYTIQGYVKQIRMKKGCLPTRFDCQPDREKTISVSETDDVKKRKKLIEGALKEYEARQTEMIDGNVETKSTESRTYDMQGKQITNTTDFNDIIIKKENNTHFVQINECTKIKSADEGANINKRKKSANSFSKKRNSEHKLKACKMKNKKTNVIKIDSNANEQNQSKKIKLELDELNQNIIKHEKYALRPSDFIASEQKSTEDKHIEKNLRVFNIEIKQERVSKEIKEDSEFEDFYQENVNVKEEIVVGL